MVKLPPPLSKTCQNYARSFKFGTYVHTHCNFRKYTFQCLGPLKFGDVCIFLAKNSVFCPKKYLCSKQQCESCVRGFLVLFSVFVRQKVTITENITFAHSVSGIRPPDCSKLAKNPKNDSDVTNSRHDFIVKIF